MFDDCIMRIQYRIHTIAESIRHRLLSPIGLDQGVSGGLLQKTQRARREQKRKTYAHRRKAFQYVRALTGKAYRDAQDQECCILEWHGVTFSVNV